MQYLFIIPLFCMTITIIYIIFSIRNYVKDEIENEYNQEREQLKNQVINHLKHKP